jgi:hypothetical protein
VIRLRRARSAIGTGLLIGACGLAAGCGVSGTSAPHSRVVEAKAHSAEKRFCVEELAAPTAAQQAAISRYWTPLVRSALTLVSQGKMEVPVPKKHLTSAQRRALERAEWAERTFGPKPRLECEQRTRGRVPASAPAVAPQSWGSYGTQLVSEPLTGT